MERLTQKKQPAGYDLVDMQGRTCDLDCRYPEVRDCSNCVLYDAIQKLAHYEDLEEQGKLIVLPCKVGDTVYECRYVFECKHDGNCVEPYQYKCERDELCEHEYGVWRVIERKFELSMAYFVGSLYFATKEEAEAKLKELQNE